MNGVEIYARYSARSYRLNAVKLNLIFIFFIVHCRTHKLRPSFFSVRISITASGIRHGFKLGLGTVDPGVCTSFQLVGLQLS